MSSYRKVVLKYGLRPVWQIIILMMVLMVMLSLGQAVAEDNKNVTTKTDVEAVEDKTPDKDEKGSSDQKEKKRDPFALPEHMKPKQEKVTEQEPKFVASKEPVSVPQITLKGYIEVEGEVPYALIEIQGQGALIVNEGDTISLQRQQSMVLKVVKLNNLSISIQVGKLGQVIVVRS